MSAAAAHNPFLTGMFKLMAALVALATVISHLLMGLGPVTYGVFAGGLLALANFGAMMWLARKIIQASQQAKAVYSLLFLVKLGVVFGVIAAVLGTLPVDGFGFAIGAVLFMPAALLSLLWHTLQPTDDRLGVR